MFTCKICKEKYKSLEGLYSHIEEEHEEMIPRDMSVEQYYYYMKTGKSHGNCVICKSATKWNDATRKYHRFCSNPKCKEKYKEEFKKRMIGKHGKVHLLNDPEQQKKMLANRSISGEYEWSSDSRYKIQYTGSYELDFLKNMDLFFNWDPEDIIMPSPHTYYYEYEGQTKFYIPDVFIPSLGLEIEIKDGGDNPNNHHKIQAVDKIKEKKKDDVMTSQKTFHYMKLINKNYANLIVFLHEIKADFEKYGDLNKSPRRFYIEDSDAKLTNKDIAVNGKELLQESFNPEEELEETTESTISFPFIRDLIASKRMSYTDGEQFRDLENFKYNYIKFINSCRSEHELEIVKKDINNLRGFLRHNKALGDKKFVNDNVIADLEKWIKYDIKYVIEDKENKIKKGNRFVGEDKGCMEVVILFDRTKNRSGKFFTLFDKDSKVVFNRTFTLNRTTDNGLFMHDADYVNDSECMVYTVNTSVKADDYLKKRASGPKMITRMFNANTTENQDFICDVMRCVYDTRVEANDITFIYSGTYKKFIEGGVE